MEIAGYPVLGWLLLIGGFTLAGWVTSFPLIMLLNLRTDGKRPDPDNWLNRHQWVLALVLTAIYLLLLANAMGWKLSPST